MTRDLHRYLPHYLVLSLIFMAGLMGLVLTRNQTVIQQGVIVSLAIAYATWGAVHHHLIGNLTTKILAEYIMVAALVMVMLSAILQLQ